MKRVAITDWFAKLIDHEAYADGPPPQKLWPFVKWCLSGSFLVLGLGIAASALTGVAEVLVVVLIGVIVDAAVGAESMNAFWSANWHLLTLWVLLLLVVRPFAFGLGLALGWGFHSCPPLVPLPTPFLSIGCHTRYLFYPKPPEISYHFRTV